MKQMQLFIVFKGIVFDVGFTYQEQEQSDYHYQGYPEYVEDISFLKHKGTCFLEFLEESTEDIKELILENIRR